jgi:hypothetical protein
VRLLRWSGLVGAVVFLAGFFMVSSVPGGGDPEPSDFDKYYVTDDKTGLAVAGLVVLSVGVVVLFLFLHYLRMAIASDLSGLAFGSGIAGLSLVLAGATLLAAPAAVQAFSKSDFVGEPIAHTFASAGFGVMLIGGALLMGLTIATFSLAGRQTAVFPSWVTITGFIAAVLQLASIIYLPFLLVPVWLALASIGGTRPSPTPAASL